MKYKKVYCASVVRNGLTSCDEIMAAEEVYNDFRAERMMDLGSVQY